MASWQKELNSDINNAVGQCYAGTSSMRDEYKSVASRVVQVVPTALYVHCNGPVLNLCLVDVSEALIRIQNNFGAVKFLYSLIDASANQHKLFEDIQKEAGTTPSPLKESCDTCWKC